eukprot:CAMPEP_0185026710 /NCGR_PEP_ID=MMETSP1103-20130426/11024_1 /TAXON_ID=36769 /ORGANISM="Paraphysomonas bandaiensis, Strain Caron Lab Isolate" /LENGTH=161 /DNA_ID=CAMNT_0027560377 /DNA_START=126 /DNA_END=611 /DNA_ORIENTATION=-
MKFLACLKLKSVVSLVLEDYPTALVDFYNRSGTELITMGLEGNKGAFKGIDKEGFMEVMRTVMNPDKRPLLIHCNKGKHRTGCVIGCVRRLRGWAVSSIVDEYMLFASPKPRLEDQKFIESFLRGDYEAAEKALRECDYQVNSSDSVDNTVVEYSDGATDI